MGHPESVRDVAKREMERVANEVRVQTHMVGLENEVRTLEAVLKKRLTQEQKTVLRGIVCSSPELSIGEAYMRVYGKA